jgi:hypothetical protein
MRKTLFWQACLLAVFCGLIWSSGAVRAQEVGIEISPVKIDKLVDPGDVLVEKIKVENKSDLDKVFYLQASDFEASGESGAPKLVPVGSTVYGSGAWVSLPTDGIPFAPREKKELEIRIVVPEGTGPGGFYGAVLVGTQPPSLQLESQDKGAAIATAQKTACLLLLQVSGDVRESAQVREFTTDKTFYSAPFEVKFMTRVENSGNTHIKPFGTISVSGMFGKAVTMKVNEQKANVLHGSIRRFDSVWQDKWAFGRYKAVLGLTYGLPADSGGQGMQTLYAEKTFWIIPWRVVGPILGGIAIFFLLMRLMLNSYKNKAVRQAIAQMGGPRAGARMPAKQADANAGLRIAVISLVITIALLAAYFLFFA